MGLTWAAWISVSDGLVAAPGTPVTAVPWGNSGFALFVTDSNGGIYTTRGDPQQGFGPWASVSEGRSTPGAPVTAVPYGEHLALFVADPNGRILTTFDLLINGSPGQWLSIGPTRIEDGGAGAVGMLTAIAIHPTEPSTMYVGGGRCGLWKTTDGGATWSAIGDSLPTMAIAAIAIDPDWKKSSSF